MENRNPEVDQWLEQYDNPQRELVAKVRDFILGCDPAMTEAIKWQAPTFMYKGNIASYFPKAKKNVTLVFHKGAYLQDDADFEAKKPALQAVILAWIRDKG